MSLNERIWWNQQSNDALLSLTPHRCHQLSLSMPFPQWDILDSLMDELRWIHRPSPTIFCGNEIPEK